MKVLHIAFSDDAGAGLGMMNQHLALLKAGVDSKVLVAQKESAFDTVYEMERNYSIWSTNRLIFFLEKVARRFGICFNKYDKMHHRVYQARKKHLIPFSSPRSQYDVTRHPLFKEADVINLHFVSGFVDVESFFSKVDKPVIWTMRDENPGLGGFHYRLTKQKYYKYFADLEEEMMDIKRKAIVNSQQLHIVSLSREMQEFCRSVDFLSNIPNTIIYNAIPSDVYCLLNKEKARRQLDLSDEGLVLSFICNDLMEERKGFKLVLNAIDILHNERIKLLCVGNSREKIEHPNVIYLGYVDNPQELSVIYAASTAFITASNQESFGKTTVEAMFCGTPVVSMPVGIASEIIDDSNGILCSNRTPQEIAKAIQKLFATKYNATQIRNGVMNKFAPERVAEQYMKLYTSMLKQ